jgi:uncharacterized protein (DUF2236 family)
MGCSWSTLVWLRATPSRGLCKLTACVLPQHAANHLKIERAYHDDTTMTILHHCWHTVNSLMRRGVWCRPGMMPPKVMMMDTRL